MKGTPDERRSQVRTSQTDRDARCWTCSLYTPQHRTWASLATVRGRSQIHRTQKYSARRRTALQPTSCRWPATRCRLLLADTADDVQNRSDCEDMPAEEEREQCEDNDVNELNPPRWKTPNCRDLNGLATDAKCLSNLVERAGTSTARTTHSRHPSAAAAM